MRITEIHVRVTLSSGQQTDKNWIFQRGDILN